MRRAEGLALLAALAAGCSTASIGDLPTAAGGSASTLIATVQAVPRAAVPVPGDGSVVPSPPPGGGGGYAQAVPDASQPVPGGYAVRIPQPTPGPPRPAPIQAPATPLEYFRGLESDCLREATLAAPDHQTFTRVEYDRFRDARVVRESGRGTALVEDGRGTRLILENWRSMGRVLPESGRADDVLPEPYRSGCPGYPFGGLGG